MKTTDQDTFPVFSLFGGYLQRLGRRLGLISGTNTLWFGVALGVLAWGVLVLLTLGMGYGRKVFSLDVIGAHVRFLVAVPLFFLCETWVAPLMTEFVRNIVRSGVVPETERLALGAVIRRFDRLKDSWLADVLLVLAAFAFPLFSAFGALPGQPGRSGNWTSLLAHAEGQFGPALGWYLWFCLPLFRFLVARWIWHLALWTCFLWRVQKLNLHLIPTHPDRVAGLGFLEVVQEHFGVLAAAISAVYAASFAEDIASGAMAFETVYRLIPLVVAINAVLFLGPLFIFSQKLWACRVTGWSEYMGMASRYVDSFDRKWIRGENPSAEPLLGTDDMQSLADLASSVDVVREMRWIPVSQRFLLSLAASALAPLLPLLLFKYPVAELATKLFQALSGL